MEKEITGASAYILEHLGIDSFDELYDEKNLERVMNTLNKNELIAKELEESTQSQQALQFQLYAHSLEKKLSESRDAQTILVKVGEAGRISIPIAVREYANIETGDIIVLKIGEIAKKSEKSDEEEEEEEEEEEDEEDEDYDRIVSPAQDLDKDGIVLMRSMAQDLPELDYERECRSRTL